MSILPADSPLPQKCGNAISGDTINPIKVRWIDDTHLAIHCEPHISPFKPFSVGNVQVIYEYFLTEDVIELPSPNSRKKAVLFRLARGVKGADTKEVSLLDIKTQVPPNSGGNILSVDKDSSVNMHWINESHLSIQCTPSIGLKTPLDIKGIQITFE